MMTFLTIALALFLIVITGMLVEMLRTPPGIEREHHIDHHKIFTRTAAVTEATPDEVIRLLQSDWSWWKNARAETMKDLGEGRKEFRFHPLRFFNLIELPAAFLVRFEDTETLPDAGKRIHATMTGGVEGRAEYTARPGPAGTTVELAWCGAEVRSVFRFAPVALVTCIHAWCERLGMEGLRERLKSRPSAA